MYIYIYICCFFAFSNIVIFHSYVKQPDGNGYSSMKIPLVD